MYHKLEHKKRNQNRWKQEKRMTKESASILSASILKGTFEESVHVKNSNPQEVVPIVTISERPDSNKDPKKLGNWYYIDNGSRYRWMNINKEMFNKDFRYDLDFYGLWCQGQQYTNQHGKERCKAELLQCYDRWMLETMLKSDVGRGTDPERKENDLFNVKAPVLCQSLFSTLTLESRLYQPFRKVHTLLQERQVSKKNKLSFGLGVNFPQISLGFTSVDEIGHVIRDLNVIGVTDEGFKWSTTSISLKQDKLHKHLDRYCRIAITKMMKELTSWEEAMSSLKESTSDPFEHPFIQFPLQLYEFMQRYGTHVILKCSHGCRMIHIKRKTVKSTKSYRAFKHKLDTNIKHVQFSSEVIQEKLKKKDYDEYFDDVLYIGSPALLKKSFSNDSPNPDDVARQDCGNVISHDETIMLADILEHGETMLPKNEFSTSIDWLLLSRIYRYWTDVRIQDLQQG